MTDNPTADTPELVVLADSDGRPAGTCLKSEVHSTTTPLHFAFSCYLLDAQGRVLLTRRALGKKTWPGVWTNSMCGHPAPGEDPAAALVRRGAEELGIDADNIVGVEVVLPDFSYRAVDSSGIVEHEICPVFLARLADPGGVNPLRHEVDSEHWVDAASLVTAVRSTPFAFSPWMVQQLADPRLVSALGVAPDTTGQ
ncbi:isopentenyl-diphosphate Delta-isomerase [Corynebacterium mendelii]|uniref:Isopentenyl-diphosphate Delta-isomerase n=1 Tax=Corynebacterium mendelii TaxID=2765362 RepID=A0A939E2G0_9CORY|nr:isopentenyl-diphosphate Delta-isomerase [Corynebacterium mendelii]MBN9644222.1 isopentenyl-diphosphate Delta-isomerase [Corynebacterium mendelii]